MRILHIIDGIRSGGKERQMVALLQNLAAKREYEIVLVSLSKGVFYRDIETSDLKIIFAERQSKFDISVLRKINKICSEFRPDIIHAWDTLSAMLAAPFSLMRGIRFFNGSIRHSARIKFPAKQWFCWVFTRMFSDVVCSNSNAGLSARGLKINSKNICIYNGFDFKRISDLRDKEDYKRELGIQGRFVAGMIANFENRKDFGTLVRAGEMLCKKYDDFFFILGGAGKNFEKIKNMVKPEFRKCFIFPGLIHDAESLVNVFDIALLLNNVRGHGEGISNSIMEYMALGKPVIATDSGGNREIVQDNVTGFIVEPYKVDDVADRLELLYNDREFSKEMGKAGLKRLERDFSIGSMVDSYSRVYREMLADG